MSGRGNPSSSRQVSDLTPPMTTNESAPDPTAGEQACLICRRPEHEHRDRNGHGFAPTPATPDADDEAGEWPDDMCPNCVTPWKCNSPHLGPATPYADDASEPWTRDDPETLAALNRVRADLANEVVNDADVQAVRIAAWTPGGNIAAVVGLIASTAATKARADERERIAQAIQRQIEPGDKYWEAVPEDLRGVVGAWVASSARIARGDA